MRSREFMAGVTTVSVFALGGSTPEETTDLRFDEQPESFESIVVDCENGPVRKGLYLDPFVMNPEPPFIDTMTFGNANEFDVEGRAEYLTGGFTVESRGGGIFEIVSSDDRAGRSEIVDLAHESYLGEIDGPGEYDLRLIGNIDSAGVGSFVLSCVDKQEPSGDCIVPEAPSNPYVRLLPLAPIRPPLDAPRTYDV